MDIKTYLIDFGATFVISLVVVVAVSYLYSLIAHGAGTIDWETAFGLAITLGVVLSWKSARESK